MISPALRRAAISRSYIPNCNSTTTAPFINHRNSSTISKQHKIIFSGIQPTGIPHLGNYLGALRNWVDLQNDAEDGTTLIYSLVDLHAITVKQEPGLLRQWRKESLAVLLAVGLDPKRATIFFQSSVPAHSELMWILSCSASVGYLSRMTQWKSKLSLEENAKPFDTPLQLGLFSYPVLQAADILVHRATHVPVGGDQSQHLEFTRTCASSFNHLYGKDVLVEPETMLSSAPRIKSLTNPLKKMSKSDPNPKSRILLTDSSTTIAKKINSAMTDSVEGITYDPDARPGLANLLQLLYYFEMGNSNQHESVEALASDLTKISKKALKEWISIVINKHLTPIRERYENIMGTTEGRKILDDVAGDGAMKARESAEVTMVAVRDAVGL